MPPRLSQLDTRAWLSLIWWHHWYWCSSQLFLCSPVSLIDFAVRLPPPPLPTGPTVLRTSSRSPGSGSSEIVPFLASPAIDAPCLAADLAWLQRSSSALAARRGALLRRLLKRFCLLLGLLVGKQDLSLPLKQQVLGKTLLPPGCRCWEKFSKQTRRWRWSVYILSENQPMRVDSAVFQLLAEQRESCCRFVSLISLVSFAIDLVNCRHLHSHREA